MIKSFADSDTENLFNDKYVKRLHEVIGQGRAKLKMLNAAATIQDLRSPPGNRLEELTGDRKGQHSIRINQKWRICFVWNVDGAEQVEVNNHYG